MGTVEVFGFKPGETFCLLARDLSPDSPRNIPETYLALLIHIFMHELGNFGKGLFRTLTMNSPLRSLQNAPRRICSNEVHKSEVCHDVGIVRVNQN